MDSGYYAAFTGLAARMQALDLVANNLANVNTTGFRGQFEYYEGVSAGIGNQLLSPLNIATNDYGVLGGADVNLDQGNFISTGNPLDLAIKGEAFFVLKTPRGIRYTRNGSFHVNATGQLVNPNSAWLEVPIVNPNNLECLHFADPQTGQSQAREPFPSSGDCPPPFSDG